MCVIGNNAVVITLRSTLDERCLSCYVIIATGGPLWKKGSVTLPGIGILGLVYASDVYRCATGLPLGTCKCICRLASR